MASEKGQSHNWNFAILNKFGNFTNMVVHESYKGGIVLGFADELFEKSFAVKNYHFNFGHIAEGIPFLQVLESRLKYIDKIVEIRDNKMTLNNLFHYRGQILNKILPPDGVYFYP